MPLLQSPNINAIPLHQLSWSASCLKNFCDACHLDAQCLTVNGKPLASICVPIARHFETRILAIPVSSNKFLLLEAEIEKGSAQSGSGDMSGSGMSGDLSGDFSGSGMSGDMSGSGMSGDLSGSGMSGDLSGMSGEISGMSGDFSGMSGELSGDSAASANGGTLSAHPSSTRASSTSKPAHTTSTPFAFTITPPPSILVEGTAQISQNISLRSVDGYKFKILYCVVAVAQTLNVSTSSIYAYMSKKPTRKEIEISYTVVVNQTEASQMAAAMQSLTGKHHINILLHNLQVQSPIFTNVTGWVSNATVVEPVSTSTNGTASSGSHHNTHVFIILAGVALGVVCLIALVGLAIVACKRTRVARRTFVTNDKRDYIQYDVLLPQAEAAPGYSSDEELLH